MCANKLEVVGVDFYSGREFVLYFSDETYVEISGESLAHYFPERHGIPVSDRGDGHRSLVRLDVSDEA
jgi:hypothetical protein